MTFDDLLTLAPTPAARDRLEGMAADAHHAKARHDPEADVRLAEVARLLEEWGRGARFPMPDRAALASIIDARFG
jgi:hypothetical protein